MSLHVLGEFTVEGRIDQLLTVLTNTAKPALKKHGCEGARVFRPEGEFDRALVLFTFANQAGFDGFVADAEFPALMTAAAVRGEPNFTPMQHLMDVSI
jgi:quinol monooxygenase YgiN